MHFRVETFTLHKRFPLTISRGTTAESTNILIKIQQDGIEGLGEASPFSVIAGNSGSKENTERLSSQLEQILPKLEKFAPWERQLIEEELKGAGAPSSIKAAIDMALHDWIGKRARLPLWQIWGLDRRSIVPTSVTIGINTPEGARQRVTDWQELTRSRIIKVKLGSPEGVEADQSLLLAVMEQAPEAQVVVDANGGWNLEQAMRMCDWLAAMGVKYVEQPLALGHEKDLSVLYEKALLPIFVDESCFTSKDIPGLAKCVHGINIKIMKAGGLSEVIRMIHIARAFGLQVMFGCYSDSTLANTAMANLSPLADYVDLDSHLNSIDDPFVGAILQQGRLIPNDLPGLGVEYRASERKESSSNSVA